MLFLVRVIIFKDNFYFISQQFTQTDIKQLAVLLSLAELLFPH